MLLYSLKTKVIYNRGAKLGSHCFKHGLNIGWTSPDSSSASNLRSSPTTIFKDFAWLLSHPVKQDRVFEEAAKQARQDDSDDIRALKIVRSEFRSENLNTWIIINLSCRCRCIANQTFLSSAPTEGCWSQRCRQKLVGLKKKLSFTTCLEKTKY